MSLSVRQAKNKIDELTGINLKLSFCCKNFIFDVNKKYHGK
jgi:hypothetical protein